MFVLVYTSMHHKVASFTNLGAVLRNALHQVFDDACVDVEKIIARHAWLARHARGDDHEFAALERVLELFSASVPSHLCWRRFQLCVEQTCVFPTFTGVLQWLRSAATPGVLAMSYSARSVTRRFILSSRLRGCPMPPAAPSTATFLHSMTCCRRDARADVLGRTATVMPVA